MAEPLEQVIKITGRTEEYERAIKKTEELTEKISEKIQKGNAVSAGSVAPLIQQHELLRREIVRVSGAIENAAPELQREYAALTAKVRDTVGITKELSQVVHQQTAGFAGWGSLIEQNAGRFGEMGKGIGALAGNVGLLGLVVGELNSKWEHTKEAVQEALGAEMKFYQDVYNQQKEKLRESDRNDRQRLGDFAVNSWAYLTGDLANVAKQADPRGNVAHTQLQYPLRPSDSQLLQSSAITDERLRKEKLAEEQKAEAAAKVAEGIQKQTIARQADLDLLRTANPFEQAEIAYLRDLKLASFEASKGLAAIAKEKAGLERQGSIDKAFGALPHDILGGMMDRAPGVIDEGVDARARMNFELDVAEQRGKVQEEHDAHSRELDAQFQEQQLEKWRNAHEQFTHDISDAFTDLALTGGENFGRMAAQHFGALTTKGFDQIFAGIFGTAGDPTKKIGTDASGNAIFQDPKVLYGRDGKTPVSPSLAKAGQAVYDYGAIAVGGYQSGKAADGNRTGATISGAASGFASGGIYGAIAGAIVGFISSAIGEQQRQSEYKFGLAKIDQNGGAHLFQTKNMEPAEVKEIEQRIQDKYDSIRNAYAKIFISAHENILDNLKIIDGKFQDNASANFMKHLDQWINGGLGDAIAGQVKGGLEKIFSTVGVGADRFDELWKKFDNLDPAKAAALFGELYEGMSKIQDAGKFFDRKNPLGANTSYFSNYADEQKKENRSTAQVMTQDYFAPILDVAKGINQLVGEEQVHAITQIAQLQEQAKNAQIAAISEIIRISQAATERKNANLENYDVLSIQHGKGTDDEKRKREADYYKTKVDEELRKVDSSKTAAEADQHSQKAQDYINKILGLGYDINEKTGNEWLQWARDATNKVDGVLSKQLDDLGTDISNANAKFWTDFNTIYDPFKQALAKVGGDLGGGDRTSGGGTGGFGGKVNDATVIVGNFGTALDAATTRLGSFAVGGNVAAHSASYTNVVNLHEWSQSSSRKVAATPPPSSSSVDLSEVRNLLIELVSRGDLQNQLLDIIAGNTTNITPTLAAALQAARSRNFAAATVSSREY